MVFMGDVVDAVAALIESERAAIDAAMEAVAPRLQLGVVLPYWAPNLDLDSMPAILVAESSETSVPHAMPDVYREGFVVNVWGLVHHDDAAIRHRGCLTPAREVKRILNSRHHPIPLDEGGTVPIEGRREIYFHEKSPVSDIAYGVAEVDRVFVRAFQAVWASHATVQVRNQ